MDAQAKQAAIREAVLDTTAYFAVFGLTVSLDRLTRLLSVRANHLAVVATVRELMRERVLQRVGDEYGLAGQQYRGGEKRRQRREELLQRGRRVGRLIGWLPFVKAVVVVNSVALGNVHEKSDVDLLIVTTPGRIFTAKGVIWRSLARTGWLASEQRKAGRITLKMFLTIRGVPVERDIMRVIEPHLRYWLLTAEPVYGAKRWAEVLQASPYVRTAAPNMLWPRGGRTIDRWSWRWLDSWDDRSYRRHLKAVSQEERHRRPEAFVRVRPDIVNLHEHDKSGEIAEEWRRVRRGLKY